jgi:hypothetical protein
VVDFYYILFDSIISGKNPDHGREGFYFLESGEYAQKQITEPVAAALFKAGKVISDKPVSLTEQELEDKPIVRFLFSLTFIVLTMCYRRIIMVPIPVAEVNVLVHLAGNL